MWCSCCWLWGGFGDFVEVAFCDFDGVVVLFAFSFYEVVGGVVLVAVDDEV